jgi:hypothetical protein
VSAQQQTPRERTSQLLDGLQANASALQQMARQEISDCEARLAAKMGASD